MALRASTVRLPSWNGRQDPAVNGRAVWWRPGVHDMIGVKTLSEVNRVTLELMHLCVVSAHSLASHSCFGRLNVVCCVCTAGRLAPVPVNLAPFLLLLSYLVIVFNYGLA